MKAFFLGLGTFLLFSCNMASNVEINQEGGARIGLEIQVFHEFMLYLADLGELTDANLAPFDGPKTQARLRSFLTVSNPKVSLLGNRGIKLDFQVSSLEAFFQEATGQRADRYMSLRKHEQGGDLEFRLTKENFLALVRAFQEEVPPSAEIFLPSPEAPFTPEEYEELMEFILEPYTQNIRGLLDEARVKINLTLPGPILKVNTGSYQGQLWSLDLPLSRVMSLDRDLILQVSYGAKRNESAK